MILVSDWSVDIQPNKGVGKAITGGRSWDEGAPKSIKEILSGKHTLTEGWNHVWPFSFGEFWSEGWSTHPLDCSAQKERYREVRESWRSLENPSSSSPDCRRNLHKYDVFVTSKDTGEEKSNRGNKAAQNWRAALPFFRLTGEGERMRKGTEGEEHLGLLESEEMCSCCPDLHRARMRTTGATLLRSSSEARITVFSLTVCEDLHLV